MCGRYIFAEEPKNLCKRFNIKEALSGARLEIEPMYNIAPGFLVPVIIKNSPNTLEIMKWGLIPHWAKDPKIGNRLINARAETVAQKPSFRESFKVRRCLVPATGFYEWKKTGNDRAPYLIQMKTNEVFSFAGIYDVWKDVEGKEFKTFSIITTQANKPVKPIHHRMPVILEAKDEESWLDKKTTPDNLQKLLMPYPEGKLEAYTVSIKVNNPRNQGKELVNKAC